MPQLERLNDRVAVVTGGANGFGQAIAERLLSEGAHVEIYDLVEPNVSHPRLSWTRLDVGRADDWSSAVAASFDRRQRIDVLVNNAGIIAYASAHEIDLATWEKVVRVNQTGVLLGMRHVLPFMLAAKRGAIVNISSTLAFAAVPGAVAYHATKGAVTQMTRNAAVTYAAVGVRVNEVLPGAGDTRMVRDQAEEFTEAATARTPMKRLAKPSEIAAAVAFLASDDASFVTGASLPVDGGYLAQ